MRFPSQNPILAIREADELILALDNESHEIAAQAYYTWWESNEHRGFDAFKNVDPLESTAYRWH